MFTKGKTLQRIRQSIHRAKNIQYAQNQQRNNFSNIQKQLSEAGNEIKKINKKQLNILSENDKKNVEKNLQKAMSVSPYKYNNLINPQNYTYKIAASHSLVPIINKISVQYLANLIQMQDQIDPTTKQLVTMHSGAAVHQFVTYCMTKNNSGQLFDALVHSLNPMQRQHKNQVFLQPLLKKTMQVISFFGYVVKRDDLLTLLFNSLYQHPITEVQLQQMHSQAIIQAIDKASQIFTSGFPSMRDYLIQLIILKRLSYQKPEKNFFAVVKPQQLRNYDDLIKQTLVAQSTRYGDVVGSFISQNL